MYAVLGRHRSPHSYDIMCPDTDESRLAYRVQDTWSQLKGSEKYPSVHTLIEKHRSAGLCFGSHNIAYTPYITMIIICDYGIYHIYSVTTYVFFYQPVID